MRYVCLLLMALGSGVGCFHFPFVDKGDAKAPTTVRRAPVQPEQVKDTTAHKVAEALEEEVTIDETTSPKPAVVEKKEKGRK